MRHLEGNTINSIQNEFDIVKYFIHKKLNINFFHNLTIHWFLAFLLKNSNKFNLTYFMTKFKFYIFKIKQFCRVNQVANWKVIKKSSEICV